MRHSPRALVALVVALFATAASAAPTYPWRPADAPTTRTIASAIAPPTGYTRVPLADGSFGAWLRGLPLRAPDTPVLLFDGRQKGNQEAHHAVVELDVGTRDRQQCADAIMRLRAEYLWSVGAAERIAFHFTSGDLVPWSRWAKGERPVVRGRDVGWTRGAKTSRSHDELGRYLARIFTYAGSASLQKELHRRALADVAPGDVLVQGGFPGHAVIVLDMAADARGERLVLIGQSYMPAQDFHVLRNPTDAALSPWYRVATLTSGLLTPEWRPFTTEDLRTFE